MSLLASVVVPAQAAPYETGVFSVPYGDAIYRTDREAGTITQLSYAQWVELGRPTPKPSRTEFVKYSWAPEIFAVTFFGPARSEWVWHHVSLAEWRRAGSPKARNAGWIEGSYWYRWGTSTEVFVMGPGQSPHKLTGAQWDAAGRPAFHDRTNEGFIGYTWDPTIVRMSDLARGQGTAISYDEWRYQGFPTPRKVTRVTGDQVYKYAGQDTIWYAGPGLNRPLTLAEWKHMGSPTPTVRGVDCSVQKCIALTFDDGPGPYTQRLLDILSARGAKATFFWVGNRVANNASVAKAVVAGGHQVGNHSWNHADLTTLSNGAARSQLADTNAAIKNTVGVTPTVMRPPYGANTSSTRSIAGDLGLAVVNWNIDTLDWKHRNPKETRRIAVSNASDGSIILMHDIHSTTVDAVAGIVDDLQAKGYALVTLDELNGGRLTAGKLYSRF